MRRFLQEYVVRAEQMLGAPTFAGVSFGVDGVQSGFLRSDILKNLVETCGSKIESNLIMSRLAFPPGTVSGSLEAA
jgi:hypothetical protein